MKPSSLIEGLSDLRDTASPFGVLTFLDWNHDWNARMYDGPQKITHAVDIMADAGIKMVRQVISWDEVERKQGTFDFSKYDSILNELERRRLRMLAVLCYTAECTGKSWNSAPDLDLFTTYTRQTVRRYKGRIKYWEVWNEPDQRTYWQVQDGMKTYVELLKAVYAVIKEEDPTAVVVLGSVSSALPLLDIYRQGAQGFFDVINVHPFVSPLAANALDDLRSIYTGIQQAMEKSGGPALPIWFTELGCPGVTDPKSSKGWWKGTSPTELQQAEWLTQVYNEPLRWPGIKRIFWAFFQDTRHFGDDIDCFGLVKRDFTPKLALAAYRRSAEAWGEKPQASASHH